MGLPFESLKMQHTHTVMWSLQSFKKKNIFETYTQFGNLGGYILWLNLTLNWLTVRWKQVLRYSLFSWRSDPTGLTLLSSLLLQSSADENPQDNQADDQHHQRHRDQDDDWIQILSLWVGGRPGIDATCARKEAVESSFINNSWGEKPLESLRQYLQDYQGSPFLIHFQMLNLGDEKQEGDGIWSIHSTGSVKCKNKMLPLTVTW